jgi:alanyl-tRNA synthetase
MATACNHTATHLLQAALRKVLGEHLHQCGSLVTPERLRFDFTHFEKIPAPKLSQVEHLVNQAIALGIALSTTEQSYAEAVATGATALFDEKYGDRVRVVTIGNISQELCGGTHVTNTAQIRLFRIMSESSVATGVRRIEAVTGDEALRLYNRERTVLSEIARLLKTDAHQVTDKVGDLLRDYEKLQDQAAKASGEQALRQVKDLFGQVREVAGVKYVAARLDGLTMEQLREATDRLRDHMVSGVVVLGAVTGGKIALVVGVTKDLTARIQAGALIKIIAAETGGSGGGRPDLAQAGGKDPAKLDQALEKGEAMLRELVGA